MSTVTTTLLLPTLVLTVGILLAISEYKKYTGWKYFLVLLAVLDISLFFVSFWHHMRNNITYAKLFFPEATNPTLTLFFQVGVYVLLVALFAYFNHLVGKPAKKRTAHERFEELAIVISEQSEFHWSGNKIDEILNTIQYNLVDAAQRTYELVWDENYRVILTVSPLPKEATPMFEFEKIQLFRDNPTGNPELIGQLTQLSERVVWSGT